MFNRDSQQEISKETHMLCASLKKQVWNSCLPRVSQRTWDCMVREQDACQSCVATHKKPQLFQVLFDQLSEPCMPHLLATALSSPPSFLKRLNSTMNGRCFAQTDVLKLFTHESLTSSACKTDRGSSSPTLQSVFSMLHACVMYSLNMFVGCPG